MTGSNPFAILQALLPQARVVVGVVTAIGADHTSTVQLPGPNDLAGYAANVFTGPLIRARGDTVPVGSRAFVRDWSDGWVIETQAPGGAVLDLPVGSVVLPAPPAAPVEHETRVRLRSATAGLQYLSAYQATYPAVVGLGGTWSLTNYGAGAGEFYSAGAPSTSNVTLSESNMLATLVRGSTAKPLVGSSVGLTEVAAGYYAFELELVDRRDGVAAIFGALTYLAADYND